MAVQERLKKVTRDGDDVEDTFDLDDLLHPAQAFSLPSDVVNDPDLTLNESARSSPRGRPTPVRSDPLPRCRVPNGSRPVGFDEIMDALRALDKQAHEAAESDRYRRVLRRH